MRPSQLVLLTALVERFIATDVILVEVFNFVQANLRKEYPILTRELVYYNLYDMLTIQAIEIYQSC